METACLTTFSQPIGYCSTSSSEDGSAVTRQGFVGFHRGYRITRALVFPITWKMDVYNMYILYFKRHDERSPVMRRAKKNSSLYACAVGGGGDVFISAERAPLYYYYCCSPYASPCTPGRTAPPPRTQIELFSKFDWNLIRARIIVYGIGMDFRHSVLLMLSAVRYMLVLFLRRLLVLHLSPYARPVRTACSPNRDIHIIMTDFPANARSFFNTSWRVCTRPTISFPLLRRPRIRIFQFLLFFFFLSFVRAYTTDVQ